MKLLRLILLLLSLAAAALATYLFERVSLLTFFPDWLLNSRPALSRFTRWLPNDLLTVALTAALVACLGIGLSAPAARAPEPEGAANRLPRRAAVPFVLVLGLSAVAAVLLAAGERWVGLHGWLLAALWLVWLGVLYQTASSMESGHPAVPQVPRRSRPWRALLPVLALAAFLLFWRAGSLPAAYPAASYIVGIQAQETWSLLARGPFAVGAAGLPALATLWTALGQSAIGNPFLGVALTSGLAALICIAVLWLLASELFRRVPIVRDDVVVEDDGRVPALLAAGTAAVMLPLLALGRLPWLLETPIWGMLGLWALLRAQSGATLRWATVGGIFLGLGALWGPGGWLFAGVGVLGFGVDALLRRRGPVRGPAALLALAAGIVSAAPALCRGGCGAQSPLLAGLPAQALARGLNGALSVVGLSADLLPTPEPALTLGLVLGTLLLLGLGALLFHLDHPAAWLVLPWCAGAALLAARHSAAPLAQGANWMAVALLLPAAALAIAFALDRLRAALAAALGVWAAVPARTFSLGLLLVVGLMTWQRLAPAMGRAPGAADAVARAAAAVPDGAALTLLDDGSGLTWEHPALRFALGGSERSLRTLTMAELAAWQPAAGEVLFAPAGLHSPVAALREQVPGADLDVTRDQLGTPTLYMLAQP